MLTLQFLSSRPSSPVPFRPKRSNTNDLPSPASSPGKSDDGNQNGNKGVEESPLVSRLEASVNGAH
jgi:2-isopropylmalate synthase